MQKPGQLIFFHEEEESPLITVTIVTPGSTGLLPLQHHGAQQWSTVLKPVSLPSRDWEQLVLSFASIALGAGIGDFRG